MCFYDQSMYRCGDYKWGHFRQHCSKEYRTGETCGMKLAMTTHRKAEKCKICDKIDVKNGRIEKEMKRIDRWYKEMQQGLSRSASIEASEATCAQLTHDIEGLLADLAYSRRCL